MIDTEAIGMEIDAMIDQANIETDHGVAQAIGSCVAVALGYEPFGIEAINLSAIAVEVLVDTIDPNDRDYQAIATQTIARCASIPLGKKSDLIMFADPIDSNLMESAGVSTRSGCNPISLIVSLMFGGIRQLMIYPSTRGLGRRFTAGVTTVAIKNATRGKK